VWGAVLLFSALALFDAVFDYVWTGNGIHGTEGALLVVVSTLLMSVAAILIGRHIVRGGFLVLLTALLAIDFVGTGLAAYLLEAWVLLALNVLAASSWLASWLATFSTERTPSTAS
jgi:hypothetical protein